MNRNQSISALVAGTTTVMALVAQPAQAAQTEVTNIQLREGANGIELVLNTQGNNRPPIFTVSRGNSTIADINDTQLRLTGGNTFKQANPAPGITAITVSQLDIDTVRVTVQGTNQAPAAQVIRQDQGETLVLSYKLVASLSESTPSAPTPLPPATGQRPNAVPPFRSRAVAPPVGDIAVAPVEVGPDTINLDTDMVIPRLLLRDAPVREVLTLIGRAAGVNVAYTEGARQSKQDASAVQVGAEQQDATQQPNGASRETTISLDIENEPAQDVFNFVLRLANLEANRVGNTIFVSPNLPDAARNLVTRSLRLNQVLAVTAANFLASRGADFQFPFERLRIETVGEGASARTVEIREPEIKLIQPDFEESRGPLPLDGLSVSADERLNILTLVGSPQKVQIASSFLTQLDARRRQVAINIKFVDVNLLKQKNANADLQFSSGVGSGQSVVARFLGNSFQIGAGLGRDFLLNLIGAIRDQDAKILTNPTLVVQEGSTAVASLTQETFQGTTVTLGEDERPTVSQPDIEEAGVQLNIEVNRVDDNGFVALRIQPQVSSLSGRTFEDATGATASLLQRRSVDTGVVRLRDGQTLILAGIIQDEDRVDVSKVPLLGDIPILGRLFRSETKTRERRELVVMVTPKILDDSDQSTFGYEYTPGSETQKLLDR